MSASRKARPLPYANDASAVLELVTNCLAMVAKGIRVMGSGNAR